MAHARHKFSEAVKAQGENKRTSKANGLEPYAYLRHFYTQLSKAESVDATEALLPGNIKPPIILESSVGQDRVCVCGGAGQGAMTRNSCAIPRNCNAALCRHKRAIFPVA